MEEDLCLDSCWWKPKMTSDDELLVDHIEKFQICGNIMTEDEIDLSEFSRDGLEKTVVKNELPENGKCNYHEGWIIRTGTIEDVSSPSPNIEDKIKKTRLLIQNNAVNNIDDLPDYLSKHDVTKPKIEKGVCEGGMSVINNNTKSEVLVDSIKSNINIPSTADNVDMDVVCVTNNNYLLLVANNSERK